MNRPIPNFREHDGLSFDDVLLVPKCGILEKRAEAKLRADVVNGISVDIPILSAPMTSVTNGAMAAAMFKSGAFGVIHRFQGIQEQAAEFENHHPVGSNDYASCAIGLHDYAERCKSLLRVGCFVYVLDIAHAHHRQVEVFMRWWKGFNRDDMLRLIVGNVATAPGATFLKDLGVDGIKVGIGPGAACSTREVTGFGYPQLSAILEINESLNESGGLRPTLIADGGIKNSGDIVKALAAGADTVMCGKILAEADEAPHPGEYFGMASKRVNGHNAPEGEEGEVPVTGSVSEIIKKLAWGVKSGISYAGAVDLNGLRSNAEFVRIAPGVQKESGTRLS